MDKYLSAKEEIAKMELKIIDIEKRIDKGNKDQLALLMIAKGLLELLKQALNTI